MVVKIDHVDLALVSIATPKHGFYYKYIDISSFLLGLRSLLRLLCLGRVLLDLSHYAAVFTIGKVGIRVVLKLELHELVDLHLFDHVLGELLFVDVDTRVAETHRVS